MVSIPAPPPQREARELLELVLAAASLDLPVEVVFENNAASLLSGPAAGAWLQLAEQGLASLFVVSTDDSDPFDSLAPGVTGLAAAELPLRFAQRTWIRA
ncbi:MAG: hypothetical protein EA419_07350 [Wenzhouxiangella sp.]|nr:MAG: hypothetical protein EA419_07350 [Wenzhouxiangella sp.]